MLVKDRLLEFIKFLDIPVRKFEEECSMSNGYVSSMRKGLGERKLQKVLDRYPQLNREWLLYGEGEMTKDVPPHKLQESKEDVNVVRVLEEKIVMLENIIEHYEKLLAQKDILIDKLLNK